MTNIGSIKNILSTTAILAAMTSGNTASAQGMAGDWYGSLFGGYSMSTDAETSYVVERYDPEYTYTLNQEMDGGYILGATLGRSVMPNVRVEAEISYAKYEAGDFNYSSSYNIDSGATWTYAETFAGSGGLTATYLMGNVWLDLPDMGGTSGVVPYVGGGVGGGKLEISTDDFSGDDTVFAYQIGAGVQFPMDAGMVDIGYRFKGTGKPKFEVFGEETLEFDELYSNNLQVGYVMKF